MLYLARAGCKNASLGLTSVHMDMDYLDGLTAEIRGVRSAGFNNCPALPDYNVKRLIQFFIQEHKNHQTGYMFILDTLATQIAVCLIRTFERKANNLMEVKNISHEGISMVIDFLNENYNQDYSSYEVASLVNMSMYHFIRVFKNETGKTPYRYLLDIKIEKAREMLKSNILSVTEISSLCGFSNPSHFSMTFRKRVGVSPTEYQKQI